MVALGRGGDSGGAQEWLYGLGFDLWRRSIVALGLDLKDKRDIGGCCG